MEDLTADHIVRIFGGLRQMWGSSVIPQIIASIKPGEDNPAWSVQSREEPSDTLR